MTDTLVRGIIDKLISNGGDVDKLFGNGKPPADIVSMVSDSPDAYYVLYADRLVKSDHGDDYSFGVAIGGAYENMLQVLLQQGFDILTLSKKISNIRIERISATKIDEIELDFDFLDEIVSEIYNR